MRSAVLVILIPLAVGVLAAAALFMPLAAQQPLSSGDRTICSTVRPQPPAVAAPRGEPGCAP